MPLMNWTHHQFLGVFDNSAPIAQDTYVGLLTAVPTTYGTSATSDGTAEGAAEWSLSRVQVNNSGGADPKWARQAGDNGGWELVLASGNVEWDAVATAALAEDTTIVGFAVYTASTGGNMIGFHKWEAPRVVPVGGVVRFEPGSLKLQLFRDLTK
jgi:hypothetical protein